MWPPTKQERLVFGMTIWSCNWGTSRAKIPEKQGKLSFRPKPPLALHCKKHAEFYHDFSFLGFYGWKKIVWPIIWQCNYLIIFLADRDTIISYLINPASSILCDRHEIVQEHLTNIIKHLTYPEAEITLNCFVLYTKTRYPQWP